MKLVKNLVGVSLPVFVSFLLASIPSARAQNQPARTSIHAIHGSASCFVDGAWHPLTQNGALTRGALIKTAADATVDLILLDSGTVLRLMPDSELRFDRLDQMPTAEKPVTATRLTLLSGALIGSQRKLAAPSEFEVRLSNGVARIVGTEYLLGGDGAVTCLSGEVSVIYNRPGNGGSVKAIVAAGSSFDPATGNVTSTTAACLKHFVADVDTVRDNARTFNIGRGTLCVEDHGHDEMSPIHGHHDHDNDNGHGDNGHGDNGHGDNGHGDNGHGDNGHGNDGHR